VKQISEACDETLELVATTSERHFRSSSYREKVIEHLFVGELLKHFWNHSDEAVEVLRPEVDSAGYDLALSCAGVMRHVQLKASVEGGRTRHQPINTSLIAHSGACIIWIVVDKHLSFRRFLFFGGMPGDACPAIAQFKAAKHTRANAQGIKHERMHTKLVPKTSFTEVADFPAVVKALFGDVGNRVT